MRYFVYSLFTNASCAHFPAWALLSSPPLTRQYANCLSRPWGAEDRPAPKPQNGGRVWARGDRAFPPSARGERRPPPPHAPPVGLLSSPPAPAAGASLGRRRGGEARSPAHGSRRGEAQGGEAGGDEVWAGVELEGSPLLRCLEVSFLPLSLCRWSSAFWAAFCERWEQRGSCSLGSVPVTVLGLDSLCYEFLNFPQFPNLFFLALCLSAGLPSMTVPSRFTPSL